MGNTLVSSRRQAPTRRFPRKTRLTLAAQPSKINLSRKLGLVSTCSKLALAAETNMLRGHIATQNLTLAYIRAI
jgi:hypothetical protein